jgi:hypothetical protein
MTQDNTQAQPADRFAKMTREERVQLEIEFCRASYRFAASLAALQIALNAADDAPGRVFFRENEVTPKNAQDMQIRWCAASIVMHDAVAEVRQTGNAMVETLRALLAG